MPEWKYIDSFPVLKKYCNPHNFDMTLYEKNYNYNKLPYRNNVLLSGYFQSEKYFIKYKDEIKKLLTPAVTADITGDTAVHVRRGDYINSHHYCQLWETDYYCLADYEGVVLVFSDDIAYCRTFFNLCNFTFIENPDEIYALAVMMLCRKHIIANSSFSWWGAWLSGSDDVTAPAQWFGERIKLNTKDLIPKRWRSL